MTMKHGAYNNETIPSEHNSSTESPDCSLQDQPFQVESKEQLVHKKHFAFCETLHQKSEFLLDFCLRMKLSGDPERYRAAIIELSLKAWDKNLLNDLLGVRPLYRTNTWKREERRKKKELKKMNWYTRTGGKVNDFPLL